MHNYLHIENARMVFDTKKGKFTALTDINLTVKQGEFIALIGHSGCGKSTLLNLVAGLTEPTDGILLLSEREISGPGPERAVVFQNHSLLPWLTCFGNVYLAVERVFAQQNTRTAMGTAQASAMALLAATHAGVPVVMHTPSEVKAAVTGNGRADKQQVTAMVTRLLRLQAAPRPADAADALALAICHAWRAPLTNRIQEAIG